MSSSATVHEAVEVLRIVGPAGTHEVPDIVLGLVLDMNLGRRDGPGYLSARSVNVRNTHLHRGVRY